MPRPLGTSIHILSEGRKLLGWGMRGGGGGGRHALCRPHGLSAWHFCTFNLLRSGSGGGGGGGGGGRGHMLPVALSDYQAPGTSALSTF